MAHTRVVVLAGACLLGVATIVASFEQAAMRITKDPQGYWFSEGDTRVLFYQAERKALPDGRAARSNYFRPFYDLDGTVVTPQPAECRIGRVFALERIAATNDHDGTFAVRGGGPSTTPCVRRRPDPQGSADGQRSRRSAELRQPGNDREPRG
jgi:hypothetical protein